MTDREIPTRSRSRAERPEDTAEHVVRLMEDGFNSGESWRIEELVAEHFMDHGPFLGGADFRQRLEQLRAILPDARLHVEEVVRQGDYVATRWTIRGTHRGKTLGIPPTGRPVSLSGISVERLKDGKVLEHWEFPDLAAFAQELEAGVA